MKQENWDDLRIAWQLAQSGTLTKTGKVLRLNHTTVLRHINRLEESLSIRLFIRTQRGYQLTDAGRLMFEEMPAIEQGINRLVSRLEDIEQSDFGKLRITTTSGHSVLLNRAVESFREEHPNMLIRIMATDETIPVESGSMHISIRVGDQPVEPDVIARKIMPLNIDYYASESYIDRYGLPKDCHEYSQHHWAMPSGSKQNLYFIREVLRYLNDDQIIYQSNLFSDLVSIVKQGLAIGPMVRYEAEKASHLVPLKVPFSHEDESLWFVYHRDLKNNLRIKSFYNHLCTSLKQYQK